MLNLEDYELGAAERRLFADEFKALAKKYGSVAAGSDAEKYGHLVLRCITMRCRKNGILDIRNIEKFLDVFLRDSLSEGEAHRLMTIVSDPVRSEDAKMAELRKQFFGEKPSAEDGFRIWKMP